MEHQPLRKQAAAVLGVMLLLAWHAAEAVVVKSVDDDGGGQQQQQQQQVKTVMAPLESSQKPDCEDYIVQLKDLSAVSWAAQLDTRSSSSSSSTRSSSGRPVSAGTLASPAVTQYAAFVRSQANAVATRALGGTEKVSAYYQYAFSGFFVKCVDAKGLVALKRDPGVASVTPNTFAKPATISTPHFLGLDAAGGIWSQLGGADNAGEDVVIGVLDSGYWPEAPSFSDQRDPNSNSGGLVYSPLPSFKGKCLSGSEPASAMCNNKVLSCQHFIYGAADDEGDLQKKYPYEHLNCRDAASHGSHTASIAAGNAGSRTDLNTSAPMSGVAPRARLAIYKVCWGKGKALSCPVAAIIAAVDVAVTDGVHILSVSLSGTATILEDPLQLAFKDAAAHGIFIAAAAGNAAANRVAVQHPSPWVTTVASSTHSRVLSASATLGDSNTTGSTPSSFTGAGLFEPSPLGPLPLVLGSDAALPGPNAGSARWCINGTLDPDKVRGKVVVCDRGGNPNARVLKSAVVAAAGGVAMILVNAPDDTNTNIIGTDHHAVPTVHLRMDARDSIRAYAAAAGDEAAVILTAKMLIDDSAPQISPDSLPGPTLAARSEVLKPDLTAPGVNILGVVSPEGSDCGCHTDFFTGTSMATPHVAGAAALLKQVHPSWSPMSIKSALMTTAYQTTKSGRPIGKTPFTMGAGHIQPNPAVSPGLVFNSGLEDWNRFLCGSSQDSSRNLWFDLCPECVQDQHLCELQRLNLPSIAAANMPGKQVITRTVTSVLEQAASFSVSITKPAGFDVSVSPATFSLDPGASLALEITLIQLAGTALNTYSDGSITWTSSQGTTTRIPLVVRAEDLSFPRELRFAAAERPRSWSYPVWTGYSGSLHTLAIGLQPARVFTGVVTQDPDKKFDPSDPAGTTAVTVSIPQGRWAYVRLSLFESDLPDGVDLDLHVYDKNNVLVGESAGTTSDEQVSINPANSTSYKVYIHGFNVSAAGGAANFKLWVWTLRMPGPGSSNARSLPSANKPMTVHAGDEVNVSLALNARLLAPSQRWLGAVLYAAQSAATGSAATVAPAVPEMTLLTLV